MRPERILFKGNPSQFIELEKLNFLIGKNGVGKTAILRDLNQLLSGEIDPLSYANLPDSEIELFGKKQIKKFHQETWTSTNVKTSFGLGKSESNVEIFYIMDSIKDQFGSRYNSLYTELRSQIRKLGIEINDASDSITDKIERLSKELLSLDNFPELKPTFSSSSKLETFGLSAFRLLLLRAKNLTASPDASSNPIWQLPTVLKVSNAEGKSTLMVRVPRANQQLLEVLLARTQLELEEVLPNGEYGKCLYSVELAKKHSQFGIAEGVGTSLTTVPAVVYRWDQDILIPVLEISDVTSGPRAILAAEDTDLNRDAQLVEAIVLEWASFIGKFVTENFWDPQVRWIYRIGSSAESGSLANPFPPDPSPISSQYRIHPAILIACKFISRYVSENLPGFIKENFTFHLEPIGPDQWIGNKRVRYGLVAKEIANVDYSDPIAQTYLSQMMRRPHITSLEYVGAGVRRWTLTVLSMLRGSASRCSVGGTYQEQFEELLGEHLEACLETWDDADYAWELWGAICDSDDLYEAVEVSLNDGGFLLIDEPEANLHPEGVDSIRQWLVDQSVHFGTVIVVTHDARIFDTAFPSTARYLVHRPPNGRNREISRVLSDPSVAADWQKEIGVTPGEMFLATKRWLFVEGEVDRAILNNFFRAIFDERGVRILSARGSGNFQKLFQVEILRGLSASVSVLLDREAPDAKGPDASILREGIEKGYFKRDLGTTLTESINPRGTLLGVEELPVIDVMFYLDTAIINNVLFKDDETRESMNMRPLPDWPKAWEEFTQFVITQNQDSINGKILRLTVSEFKKYLKREFGFQADPWFASRISKIQASSGRVPTELVHIIERITSPFYGNQLK